MRQPPSRPGPGPLTSVDEWSGSDAYDRYIGRWSGAVAVAFLDWLGPEPGRRWLDVGCGTGALTGAILASADPASVTGLDPSVSYLSAARGRVRDDRARFVAGDASRLPLRDGSADAVVSGLMLNFVPDPEASLRDMRRVVRAEGTVAAYVWDYSDGMQMLRRFWDAAMALDPGARESDEGQRFPICDPDRLGATARRAGLAAVDVRPIDVETRFADFDDYWTPFLGGQGPGGAYVAGLGEAQRDRLREALRESSPVAADGSISLIARAWAVRGTVRRPHADGQA